MTDIILINPPRKACSVHAMGLNLWRIVQRSVEFRYLYLEPESLEHLLSVIRQFRCRLVLNNHMPLTLPWLDTAAIDQINHEGVKQVALISHGQRLGGFAAYLMPDPTKPSCGPIWSIGRPLPAVTKVLPLCNRVPTIGSAGFLAPHKRLPFVVSCILREFDEAHIRLHVGRADYSPYELNDVEECHRLVAESGKEVYLKVTRNLMSPDEMADWLAVNDLNVFLYAGGPGAPAPAMGPDPAISARRPIAITKDDSGLAMFHACRPSICLEDNSLKTIIANGLEPLLPIYERNSDERVLADIEARLKSL